MDVEEFVAGHLPAPPRLVLEVGCGTGDLALALSNRGYAVTAIDPAAPDGPIFQRISLEQFSKEERFHAVVANRSLHHVADLAAGLAKVRCLLDETGVLILNEFAWDQMDERSARWYLSHVSEPRHEDESLLPGNFPEAWIREHHGLHDSITMRAGLDDLFHERLFEWIPYISQYYLENPDLIGEEERLIRSGDINALAFRYVGVPRH